MNQRLAGLLGILNRGGKLLIGAALPQSLKGVYLVIYSSDASKNTLDKYLPRAEYLVIPTIEVSTKAYLGKCIGYDEISVIGVKDQKAAKALLSAWKGE